MKMKLLIAASALLALTACDKIGLSQKAEPVAEAPVVIAPPTAEEAAAILAKMDTAFASGDPVQVGAVIRCTKQKEDRGALNVLAREVDGMASAQQAEELTFDC